jgi:NAD(P)-dependent dehydrogenase (short-subunit alcohol dehydrogenase family)
MKKELFGKVAVITGATHGLGFEIAKKFASEGANLVLCGRNHLSLERALNELNAFAGPNQSVIGQSADVSNLEDVEALAKLTNDVFGTCDILVNNAGIWGPKGDVETVDWGDWLNTIEINLFGSVHMCRALVPKFKELRRGKIIQLSGGGATKPMPKISAYAVSKAAVVRFIETLAEELKSFGVDVNALAPGALNTRMLDELISAGPETLGADIYEGAIRQKECGGSSIAQATDLALFLASSRSDGITGKLISAVWDNWEGWPSHIRELANTDAYTLRRIIGADRGMGDWGDK